ncbi:acyl-CoA dehydrogenase family protein [Mycobacterium colombiense]|uniref:acyl-CoA dehydrogenase family protein n=1 Tax=Mycobacterium colombiense TaxID=339268 RepID=UPI0012DB1A34
MRTAFHDHGPSRGQRACTARGLCKHGCRCTSGPHPHPLIPLHTQRPVHAAHTARPQIRGLPAFVINGAKTYITGVEHTEHVIVLARTSDPVDGNRRKGLSLLVVEAGMPGFGKGRRLEKMGVKAQAAVELSFEDVGVPASDEVDHHQIAQFVRSFAIGALTRCWRPRGRSAPPVPRR